MHKYWANAAVKRISYSFTSVEMMFHLLGLVPARFEAVISELILGSDGTCGIRLRIDKQDVCASFNTFFF